MGAQFTQEQISATDIVELVSSQQLTTQLEVAPMEEGELPSFVCFTACVQQGLGSKDWAGSRLFVDNCATHRHNQEKFLQKPPCKRYPKDPDQCGLPCTKYIVAG